MLSGERVVLRPIREADLPLSYQLYDERHAGHGYTTEAVQLLVDYLCATKQQHRIHLVIVPGNEASMNHAG